MSKNKEFSITSAERYSLALFELSEENNLLSQIEDQSLSMINLINHKRYDYPFPFIVIENFFDQIFLKILYLPFHSLKGH